MYILFRLYHINFMFTHSVLIPVKQVCYRLFPLEVSGVWGTSCLLGISACEWKGTEMRWVGWDIQLQGSPGKTLAQPHGSLWDDYWWSEQSCIMSKWHAFICLLNFQVPSVEGALSKWHGCLGAVAGGCLLTAPHSALTSFLEGRSVYTAYLMSIMDKPTETPYQWCHETKFSPLVI